MHRASLVVVAGALILALRTVGLRAAEGAAAAGDAKVPLYTNEDLERMFGPPGPEATGPVDKTTPEDWAWVEKFLDRQYARIDADRQADLDRRSAEIAANQPSVYGGYPGFASLGLGYPASVWWNTVWWKYTNALHTPHPPPLTPPRPGSSRPGAPAHRAGGGSFHGGGRPPMDRAGGHGAR